jgi:hypothetical protein
MYVRKSLAIAGNHEALGNWVPNKVLLYDDGTHGDEVAGDSTWSLEVLLPEGFQVEYKYTNSGAVGSWQPGEEFSGNNRAITVRRESNGRMIVRDTFGSL